LVSFLSFLEQAMNLKRLFVALAMMISGQSVSFGQQQCFVFDDIETCTDKLPPQGEWEGPFFGCLACFGVDDDDEPNLCAANIFYDYAEPGDSGVATFIGTTGPGHELVHEGYYVCKVKYSCPPVCLFNGEEFHCDLDKFQEQYPIYIDVFSQYVECGD
jgi:hypothetical protein